MRLIIACAAAFAFGVVSLGTVAPAEAKKGIGSKVLGAGTKAAVRASRDKGEPEASEAAPETPRASRDPVEAVTATPVVAPAPKPVATAPTGPLKVNDVTCMAGCYK